MATRSVRLMKYDGRIILWDDIVGEYNRKYNFAPRAIVWKVLADDGMPIKSIARLFERSSSGISSGIKRLNERLPYDEQAAQLFDATKYTYHAKTHATR